MSTNAAYSGSPAARVDSRNRRVSSTVHHRRLRVRGAGRRITATGFRESSSSSTAHVYAALSVSRALDCYRITGDHKIAETLANEVIQAYTDFDGQERSPMRLAEARITLGVVRAQEGDLDAAIDHGVRALQGKRKSLPTLLMASRDLTKILNDRYSSESKTRNYLDQVNALTALIPRQH